VHDRDRLRSDHHGTQRAERRAARPVIEEIGRRHGCRIRLAEAAEHPDELARALVGQGLQEHGADNGKHGGGAANTERQHQHHGTAERGLPADDSQRVTNVAHAAP
jgi:hypothetical protein